MATGWAHEGAVLEQIEDTITDAVSSARARLPQAVGENGGRKDCIDCGDDIPEARRKALPGVTTCVACQTGRDRRVVHEGFNRRGSKDSQLR